ncbi:MAG: cytochrome c5 family protein [Cellvibrionaceae bacterium]|nr:cytochrome c5 family protein [Cellvibrionaceae bacterium]
MLLRTAIFTLVIFTSTLTLAAEDDALRSRIAPVGHLCMAGDACAAAVVKVAAGPRSGEDIYSSKCIACHSTPAVGAPVVGDAASWAPRIAKGMQTLYDNALNGFQGMPAKGLCMDCSPEEINATVDYMVEQSQ